MTDNATHVSTKDSANQAKIDVRVIMDLPRSPAMNMALDEVLLNGNSWVLRRTAWLQPATTIGRFQRFEQFEIDGQMRCPVRRITGGGAILHGNDCTLGLVLPTPSIQLPSRNPLELATRAAQCLDQSLSALGKKTSLRAGEHDEREQQQIADCFQRLSPFDLIVDSEETPLKAVGLALHRRGNRVLIQASIQRKLAPLSEAEDSALFEQLARSFGIEHHALDSITTAELQAANALCDKRYDNPAWNQRR